jgi:hypothetical protein
LLAGGPRFARDAFGPMLACYLGWRLLGFDAGIAAATGLAIVGYVCLSSFVGHTVEPPPTYKKKHL